MIVTDSNGAVRHLKNQELERYLHRRCAIGSSNRTREDVMEEK